MRGGDKARVRRVTRVRALRPAIRLAVTAVQAARKAFRSLSGTKPKGVHALPVTPDGRMVLVKLTYAPGWRLPGGGRSAEEAAEEAILRELREEIGLTGHDRAEKVSGWDEDWGGRNAPGALFILRGVTYRPPSFSLEIDAIGEFPVDQLPAGLSRVTRAQIAAAMPQLRGPQEAI